MKKEILAYITGVTNTCGEFLNSNSIQILNHLENFVADLKEDDNDGKMIYVKRIVELNEENQQLKKYVRELEDSCENMCEVETNLQKRINKLTGPRWVQD